MENPQPNYFVHRLVPGEDSSASLLREAGADFALRRTDGGQQFDGVETDEAKRRLGNAF